LHHASRSDNILFMLGNSYDNEVCSAARALEVAGERWSLLILRNAAFAGMTRFTDFQQSLNIAPNILTKRLESFVNEGLMTTSKGNSEHFEYHLTPKGQDFKAVILALTEWGDKWSAPDGPPIVYEHSGCGGRIEQLLNCKSCKSPVKVKNIIARKTKAMTIYKGRIAKQRKIGIR
jgi:DNA-binding HxlR family transcriptional regulator